MHGIPVVIAAEAGLRKNSYMRFAQFGLVCQIAGRAKLKQILQCRSITGNTDKAYIPAYIVHNWRPME